MKQPICQIALLIQDVRIDRTELLQQIDNNQKSSFIGVNIEILLLRIEIPEKFRNSIL